MLNLFDCFVSSILCYGCEVWSFTNTDNIERVHRKFLKWLLNVKISTNNSALYGETGRYPLRINMEIRSVKYFLKLFTRNQDNCILSTMFKNMKYEDELLNATNWASKVRDLLQGSGFHDVWLFPSSVNIKALMPVLRSRLIDLYINEWHRDVDSRSSLMLFKELKYVFEPSPYLKTMSNHKFRHVISKIRLSSHQLYIEQGRHVNVPRNERKCTLCTLNDIEDEFHFILICPFYSAIRKCFIK